jgi:hypothetical protein
MAMCPAEMGAVGFALKIEAPCGGCDDTALNQVRLYCSNVAGTDSTAVESSGGVWGSWGQPVFCPHGQFMYAYRMGYEPYQGGGDSDDTGANSVYAWCRPPTEWRKPETEIRVVGPFDKAKTGRPSCIFDSVIVGVKAHVEPPQGRGTDDTALNDVAFYCKRLRGNAQ